MKLLLKHRPSPSMAVALLALFVALGGSAFAALSLPRGSVGTAQLKNGAVTGGKLHSNAVTSGKVKDHSLLGNDIRNGALGAPQLANGAVGSAQLANGAVGAPQLANGAVGALQLANGGVGTTKIANGAVTGAQIATGAVASTQLAAPEAWHTVGDTGEPGFQHSWANTGLGISPQSASFMKDQDGVVHLRGQIASGVVSTDPSSGTAFTLPAGYRPTGGDRYFSVLTTNGSNVITPAWIGINPSGNVVVGVGDNHFVALDDISFRP